MRSPYGAGRVSPRCCGGPAAEAKPLNVGHSGSTGEPDLAAKPIIDIVVVVDEVNEEASLVPPLDDARVRHYIADIPTTRFGHWSQGRVVAGAPVAECLAAGLRSGEPRRRRTPTAATRRRLAGLPGVSG
jgi:hypothetical protein